MPPLLQRPLPIDPLLPSIARSLAGNPSLVLVAPPGAGKTLRVPPTLLTITKGQVLLLQPRRLAARVAARRMAEEQGWSLGQEVGYHVRFEHRASPLTRVLVLTEGILTRRIQSDPLLEGVGAVILDEFHERSVHLDLALSLVREIQREVRPELLLVVMSATLTAEPVAAFLGCPILRAAGETYPVSIDYLERADDRPLPERTSSAIRRALREDPGRGDLLVFLPGAGEIRRTAELLEPVSGAVSVLPLHGSLSHTEQDLALRPSPSRRVILATNVAETSLTVEGVTGVVDTGYARMMRYDTRSGIDRLDLCRISVASADQRAGRAGRTAPGRVHRLWTRADHASLPLATPPEIRRIDLAAVVLEVRAWGADPESWVWFDPPEPGAIRRGEELLILLGALESSGRAVTPLGHQLARLPLHPRIGRLLIQAHRQGCVRQGAAIAAILSEKDLLPAWRRGDPLPPVETGPSDLLLRLEWLEEVARNRGGTSELQGWGIDAHAARQILRVAEQLQDLTRRLLGPCAEERVDEKVLLQLVLAGFPDRVARRREPHGRRALMVGGRGVVLEECSVVGEAELFVALQLEGSGVEPRVRLASAVERSWLSQEEESATRYDLVRERVVACRRLRYQDLILAEVPCSPDPGESTRMLVEAVMRQGLAVLKPDEEVLCFINRVRCVGQWWPELEMPRFDEADILAHLPALCEGVRSLEEVRRKDLRGWLASVLTHSQRQAVERLAPERLEVPSGSRIRLIYEEGKPPVLPVRLQEVFGLAETPRVAGGRVPVLLHLLGPNSRPVQITSDLRSFWDSTYAEVRKELRRRYPRHAWPEDPWLALPERRPIRRR